ncbi:hypothetical protein LLEC1_04232 [Akanthomyces lecanii]|uniref:Ubiquitin-like domain-containing protein n=1 Tax=Cordyceps confragosa TaxID=2714763 RepID=A0A179I808_CORDF|nr:hypothetical protein LLEC1_04232 [Akanthomyces lecanii]
MGCCFSRSAGPNSPYPGGIPNASARHINPPPLSLGESATAPSPANQDSPRRRRRRDRGPLDEHINKPLRRHVWASVDRQWARTELDTERAEYFDTRVTALPEIWQTLHNVLQILWEPPTQETNDDGQTALQTAQTMLRAAEISLPTGNLVNGAYDSFGNFYALPEWVVSDPQNIVEREHCKDSLGSGDDETQGDGENGEMSKEEKGKDVVVDSKQIQVRARLSETGNDVTVSVPKTDMVRSVIKKMATEAELSSSKKIRLAYMGKMLKENATLESQGWQDGHIVNALVFDR